MVIKKALKIMKSTVFVGLIVHERSRLFTKGVNLTVRELTHGLFKISGGWETRIGLPRKGSLWSSFRMTTTDL